jgi:hypothetical protein
VHLARILFVALLSLVAPACYAQLSAFVPQGNSAMLAVTSTSTTTPIQVQGSNRNATQRMFYNDGPNTAWVAWCPTSTCTAVVPTAGSPANGFSIPAGAVVVLSVPPNAFFAAISQSTKTASLYITPGQGD